MYKIKLLSFYYGFWSHALVSLSLRPNSVINICNKTILKMLLLDICTHLNAETFMCHRYNVFTFHKHVIFGDGLLDLK